MDIKHVGDTECIQCGECISVCPTKAIQWNGSKFFLAPNAIEVTADSSEEDKQEAQNQAQKLKKRNTVIKIVVGVLMAAVLCTALVYFNFIDGQDKNTFLPGFEEATEPDDNAEITDPNTPTKPPVGTSVGNTCPPIVIDIIGSDEKFDVQAETAAGRVVVLNFWFTTCGPCLAELPYFYDVATDYGDKISVIAIHVDQPGVNATGFIENDSGHPEWNDGTMTIGWDTGKYCLDLFKLQVFPTTVVINADGVITDYFDGSLHHNELVAAVEKALN